MSFQANPESMLRYPEQMQHDGLLTEQDQKFITEFFNTIATEEPPNMMDITHHGQASLSFHDAQTSVRGFQTGFGSNFDANAGYTGTGYIYQPIGSASITIPANHGYIQTANFHQTSSHAHNNYVQPQYPLNHQISLNNGLNIHSTGKVKSIANNHPSALYIKTEPTTVNNRRQRSQSPPRSNLVAKQALKRTPSRRKSIKNSNDVNISLNESKSDEGNSSATSTVIPTLSSSPSGLNTGSSSTTEATPASPKLTSTSESNNTQPPTPAPNRGGRGKKGHHELLTEAEKKANHIASEQKRRQNIRLGFDQLVEIVPTLSQCHRSEALILQKSVEYIQQLLMQKNELKDRVKSLQATLGDAPDHVDDSSSDGELDLIF